MVVISGFDQCYRRYQYFEQAKGKKISAFIPIQAMSISSHFFYLEAVFSETRTEQAELHISGT